jgi:preprotein translocase subunit SecG
MFSFYFLGFKKILGFLKKAFIVLAVYFIVISLFFHFLNKDKPKTTYNAVEKNRQEIYKVINDPKIKNTQEGKIAIALYRAMLCGLIGEACTDNPKDGDKNFNHSVFGFITNLIVLPYANPPASGVYWAYSGLQNAGFVPKTYAAEGIGFSAIKPFMDIWKVFRDISYMLLVLVLIAIGFMIMFRAKINPQTVISVENSLPKIVVALLLITFSFPIAGFLIDLMYISIGIIAVFFSNVQNPPTWFAGQPQEILKKFYFSTSNNIMELINPFYQSRVWQLSGAIFGILPDILKQIISAAVLIVVPPIKLLSVILSVVTLGKIKPISETTFFIPKIKEGLEKAGLSTDIVGIIIALFILVVEYILIGPLYTIAGVLVIFLILCLSLFYMFFRIFFMLLYSYIQIILLIFFSPVILAAEMIPGKSTFSSWVKNLLLNLATWPLLIIMILISQILLNQPPSQGNFWLPPFLLSINPEYIRIIISMGILFMTPDLIRALKEMTGVKPISLGLNFGAFTAGAGAIVGGALGAAGQFYTPYQFLLGQGGILQKLFKGEGDASKTLQNTLNTGRGSPGQGTGTNPPTNP